jgi:hypothetical protein
MTFKEFLGACLAMPVAIFGVLATFLYSWLLAVFCDD